MSPLALGQNAREQASLTAPGPCAGGHWDVTFSFFLQEGERFLSFRWKRSDREATAARAEDRLRFLIIRIIKVYRQKCGFTS